MLLALILLATPPTKAPAGAVISRVEQPLHLIADGKGSARVLLDEAAGLKEAAMTELLMSPGAAVAEHVHDRSAELLYVISGRASMTMGDKTYEIGPGTSIYIPAGTKHSVRVTSLVEPLRAIQVYTPGGPEQRFKAGKKIEE